MPSLLKSTVYFFAECQSKIVPKNHVVQHSYFSECKWTSGSVGSPAGPALAGPLFSGLLVSFPDCIGTHVLLNTQSCVYDVQLAIWCILLVLLLSLALHVGLLRTLPASPCLSRFRNNHLERRMLCTGSFQPSWFASLHIACCSGILGPILFF